MTTVVNRGQPALRIKREVTAIVNCPNCNDPMNLDANDVDIGHIIQCAKCTKNTYYPFEKPWYRKTKLVFGYILSLIASFLLGIGSNFAYQKLTETKPPVEKQTTAQPQSQSRN